MQRLGKPAIAHHLLASFVITLGIAGPAFGQTRTTFTSGTEAYKVDPYPAAAGTTKRPVVVLLHGIDGMGRSGKQITGFAKELEKEGYLVVVPHYFDKNDGDDSLPILALFNQRRPRRSLYVPRIAAAVDHAINLPDADKTRLALVGFSLGGGLALEHAESKPGTVNAVVNFFGYIEGTNILAQVARLPPTLILHNADDQIVKVVDSSGPLMTALKPTMVIHEYQEYREANPDQGNHPFIPGDPADIDSRKRTIAWLRKYNP